ncbi:MAG: protoporphyrinogen oxidase [Bacteroidales bacterium]|nr:protoporphyrinogen oxidase [Bacteroidales bacterium]
MKKDIVIIGAGLTGLTAAYLLSQKGKEVVVLDINSVAGGQIKTFNENGFVFESGPNTGAISNPEVAELMMKLEKTSGGKCLLETAPDASKRRLIWKGEKFHALPSGLWSAVSTPLFSLKDKFRILGEPWRKKGNNPNESVGDLARRRLGKSFVDYAVDPFLSGVYAGNPDTLVTKYALPKLYNLEQNYGSFVKGSIAKSKEPKTDRDRLATKKVFSAKGGLSNITSALADFIGSDNILLGLKNVKIEKNNGDNPWKVCFSDSDSQNVTIECNKVITTCGSYALPELLPFVDKDDLAKINNLTYAPVVQVSVGVKDALGGDYKAFGGLVPSCEHKQVLGILFPSACFTGRAPEEGALFSFFLGGVRHTDYLEKSDEEITEIINQAFHSMLGFPKGSTPDLLKIFRHKHAIPQYEVNSGERFAAVERVQNQNPGLIIAGNLRDGIGMAHRIKQATDIAGSIN